MECINIKIIGLGGIGSILSEKICRFLNYLNNFESHIKLIDGDSYEPKNFERQDFMMLGNKSKVKMEELRKKFNNLDINFVSQFLNDDNISSYIYNNDIVFVCVDNHKTRRIVSDYCSTLSNIILISGGNEYTDGNVQIYVRYNDVDITPKVTDYHPEIINAQDNHPDDLSCEELAQSDPQLYFTNLGVATIMCWAFYNIVVLKDYTYSEIYFDIKTMSASSKIRKPKQKLLKSFI